MDTEVLLGCTPVYVIPITDKLAQAVKLLNFTRKMSGLKSGSDKDNSKSGNSWVPQTLR